jgi:hypothetical protein
VGKALLRFRAELERIQINTLFIGARKVKGKQDWGSDRLPKLDDDAQFQGMNPARKINKYCHGDVMLSGALLATMDHKLYHIVRLFETPRYSYSRNAESRATLPIFDNRYSQIKTREEPPSTLWKEVGSEKAEMAI